jgi:hypothetical protein
MKLMVGILVGIMLLISGWMYSHQTDQKIHLTDTLPRLEANVWFTNLDGKISRLDNEFKAYRAEQDLVNKRVLDKLEILSDTR